MNSLRFAAPSSGRLRYSRAALSPATAAADELRIVAAPDGGSHYAPPPEGPAAVHPTLEYLLPTMLVSVDGVGPLLVLKTATGAAQSLGVALDGAGWSDVLGTIAGDDALLVITRGERARRAVQTRLKELAGLP